MHIPDARNKRGESPDDRYKTCKDNGFRSMFIKEIMGLIDIFLTDQMLAGNFPAQHLEPHGLSEVIIKAIP